ncbi:MAG: DUF1499 domain-containing protein [Oceanospirillaceae bacterium]|nr:DUF1499 domain-containing protein [Oceanospirillaceae bacterium]MCP5336023.1 DUF1499 domain-containing protein [Oceanospirillaceae bacterium]
MYKKLCAVSSLFLLAACSSAPMKIDPAQVALSPCPATPNCFSSADGASWQLQPEATWQQILQLLSQQERTELLEHNNRYAHFVVSSRLFGFKDDVELLMEGTDIHYRSASRVGYSDLGVNKKRMTSWRDKLIKENLIGR